MTKPFVLALAAAALVLGACTVTVVPGSAVETRPPAPVVVVTGGSPYVNRDLGLHAYPGSSILRQEEDRNGSQTTFEVAASLDGLYAHFHGQLAQSGWQRTELDMKRNEADARYWRSGRRLRLELKAEGQSGRYRLELRFEHGDDSSS